MTLAAPGRYSRSRVDNGRQLSSCEPLTLRARLKRGLASAFSQPPVRPSVRLTNNNNIVALHTAMPVVVVVGGFFSRVLVQKAARTDGHLPSAHLPPPLG